MAALACGLGQRRRRAPACSAALAVATVVLTLAGVVGHLCYSLPPGGAAPESARSSTAVHEGNPHGAAALQRRGALLGAGLASGLQASLPLQAFQPTSVGGETVKLNNGLLFPKASFGLQVYDDNTGQRLTETAISVGFRNFFASVLAGNQKGFARGVAASGVPREELFICGTVLSNNARGFERAYQLTKQGCDANLKAFAVGGITYVDMIMLDYPAGDCESIRGQWKAFEEMLAAGTTKSLAVSNFSPEQLDCLLSDPSATVPTVNQLPYNVGNFDPTAVEENRKRGVVVQAWSPLGSGGLSRRKLAACKEIGKAYNKTGVQVALRWILQTGATFSTQTKKREHFVEDLDVFDFELTPEEVQKIGARA